MNINNISSVVKAFPFEGYLESNHAPYYTVGETLEKHLKPGDSILDFGCGPCDKTAIASDLGFKCSAFDDLQDDWCKRDGNTQKILDFAERSNIEFSFDLSVQLNKKYDLIMMNDVLEHLHDSPRELLNSLVGSLNDDGYLFVTVPNIANLRKRLDILRGRTNMPAYDLFYWYPGNWRGPVREYTRGDLVSMTSYLGLELVELTTVHHMLGNLNKSLVPVYKAITRVFPDLSDTWSLVARKPKGWTAKSELIESEFAEIYQQKSRDLYS